MSASGEAGATALAIECELDKRYGDSIVLRGARLRVRAATIHALVGENGAGKTTLIKIIAGLSPADRGVLAVGGVARELASWTRAAARAAGIGVVQQHGASAPTLSVVENAVLGREPVRAGLLALDATSAALRAIGERSGLAIDPAAIAGELPLGAAQRAEIVAALLHGARVLILDEPTAVLAPSEVERLFAALRALAAAGATIVIVTHKLDEVRAIADDVTVLRAGATVAELPGSESSETIARAMVGGEPPPRGELVAAPAADAKIALALRGVACGELVAIDLDVRAGEIVGIAGVDGNGQRELALAIAGLARASGRIELGGRDISGASPAARLAAGLAHVPEDRQHAGLWLDASVGENLALGRADITGHWRIDRARVAEHARAQIAALDIRPPDAAIAARALSGGNQQKIVVARELSRPSLVCVVAAQPTRGVDLGAVARIHGRLRAAATAGAGVLVISADLDELLTLCHRVVVLLRGRVVGERAGDALRGGDARAQVGALMTGATTGATTGAHV